MTGEEKLNEFLLSIDNWIASKNIIDIKLKDSNVETILTLHTDELQKLNQETCLQYAYELYSYSEYIETIKNKENAVLEWADSSIWFIICKSINQYGDKYTKWQEKYHAAIKENPLAIDILKIKNHASARVSMLSNKAETIRKMAELLNSMSLSKRRQQW